VPTDARREEEHDKRGEALECLRDFLAKPFDDKKLLAGVREAITAAVAHAGRPPLVPRSPAPSLAERARPPLAPSPTARGRAAGSTAPAGPGSGC
jgi:hypothetical protein